MAHFLTSRSLASRKGLASVAAAMVLAGTTACFADAAPAAKLLFNPTAPASGTQLRPGNSQIAAVVSASGTPPGIDVTLQPGLSGYPGFELRPAQGSVWDLSAYGHVEARITNIGNEPNRPGIGVYSTVADGKPALKVNSIPLGPGETRTLIVALGDLNPAQVDHLNIYFTKTNEAETFRVDSIQAAGFPGEKPATASDPTKVKPAHGVMLGAGVALDAARQLMTRNRASASVAADGQSVQVGFTDGEQQSILVRPASGLWNLADCLEVRVKVRNTGRAPVTPSVRVDSETGPSDTIAAGAPVSPGAETEIVVPFIPLVSAVGANSGATKFWDNQPGTGTEFSSNLVTGVSILSDAKPGAKSVAVTSVVSDVPPVEIPAWLGQKPPVDGDWVKTFDDEFDGKTIDLTKWNVHAPNYWDKVTHFSKDNVVVSDGTVKLHYEKKTGFQNDNPHAKQTDYADGNLDTLGKWTQRYGYFESRMKTPNVPGLWPAFWLTTDLGLGHGSEDDRVTTYNGGMEFDIMEFLSGWGPYRHDVFFHWNGYGKDHTSVGTLNIYHTVDKDGYVTSGLLWLPGLVVIYDNGREVYRWKDAHVGNQPSRILYDMIQGGFGNLNGPLNDADLPQDYTIDYVRVWQRQDLASPVDGPKPNEGTLDAPKQ